MKGIGEHTILIGADRYTDTLRDAFKKRQFPKAQTDEEFSSLLVLNEEPCKSLGDATIAGRKAHIYLIEDKSDAIPHQVKFWFDSSTGQILRKDTASKNKTNEIIETLSGGRGSKTPATQPSADKQGRMIFDSTVYLFGDVVKAPVAGKVDSQADAMPRAMMANN